MIRIEIEELKDQLRKHLRAVERGVDIEVMDRGRPIARIVPVSETEGMTTVLPPTRPFSTIRRKHYQPARWPASSAQLLRDERSRRLPGGG